MNTFTFSKQEFFTAFISGNMTYTNKDGVEVTISNEDAVRFAQHEIDLLVDRKAKAKEAKEKKDAEPDEITSLVESVLTSDYQTTTDIVNAIGKEEITVSMVVSRLSNLVEAGVAAKDDIKVPNTKGTRKGYKKV